MQPAACWPENTEKNNHKLHTMRAFDRIGILLRAILVACVAIVVVSLLTPAPSQEIVDEFDSVGKM